MKYLYNFIFSFSLRSGFEAGAALSSATQHTMLPKFGGKWETECLNSRLTLCLPCYERDTGVKQIFLLFNHLFKIGIDVCMYIESTVDALISQ